MLSIRDHSLVWVVLFIFSQNQENMNQKTIKKIAIGLIFGVIVAFTFQKETCYRNNTIISCEHEAFDDGRKHVRSSNGTNYSKLTKPNVPNGIGAAIVISSILILLSKEEVVKKEN